MGYVQHVSADSAPVPTGFRDQLEEEQPTPSPTVGVLGSGARLTQPPDCSVRIQTDGSPTDGAEAAAGCCSDSIESDAGTGAHGSSLPIAVWFCGTQDCLLHVDGPALDRCPVPTHFFCVVRSVCSKNTPENYLSYSHHTSISLHSVCKTAEYTTDIKKHTKKILF